MVHTERPLQEKMALFWHNHFATGVHQDRGRGRRGRRHAANGGEAVRAIRGACAGQIEMFRDNALGNFRDLLVEVAKDTGDARLARRPHEHARRSRRRISAARSWSCSRSASGNYTEADVYAAARVFTGWNLQRAGARPTIRTATTSSPTTPNQHDTDREDVQLSDLPERQQDDSGARGGRRDAGRPRFHQRARARIPNTARVPGAEAVRFFVSEVRRRRRRRSSTASRGVYLRSSYDMKPVMREVLLSPEFWDADSYFARYSWPVEFVVRALKEIGWAGFSVNDALTPLSNMGQSCSSRPTSPAGSRARLVLDRRDAGADEFRVDARRQPEVQPRRGARSRAQRVDTGGAARRSSLERARRRAARPSVHRRAARTTCAPTALDRHATRSLQAKVAGARAPDRRIRRSTSSS